MKIVPEIFYTKPLSSTLLEKGQRREFWIVGPEYSDSEKEFRVIWNIVKKLEMPMEKGSYNNLESGDMQIVLWDGTFVVAAKSARYPDRLVGEGLSGVILAEAAKLKRNLWTKHIRPALSDFNGWSFHSSTPEGKNWFYELFTRAIDPENTEWSGWKMPAWRNPYVYRQPTLDEHVAKLLELQRTSYESVFKLKRDHNLQIDSEIMDEINDLTPEAFKQEIGADFTEYVGRVFNEFDEDIHVSSLNYNPAWQSFGAVDYGYTNPSVWLLVQIGPWGEINVLNEVYEEGLAPTDFADLILYRNLRPSNMTCFYADPADPGASRILESKLQIRSKPHTGGELQVRLRQIRKALRETRNVIPEYWMPDEPIPGSNRPRLMFDRKCKRTIQDFLNYRYPELKTEVSEVTEKPMKKDDHGPEALGRLFAGLWGAEDKPKGAVVHQATFKREGKQQVPAGPVFLDALANWRR